MLVGTMAVGSLPGTGGFQNAVTIPNVPKGSYICLGMAWIDDSNSTDDQNRFSVSTTSETASAACSAIVRTGSNQATISEGTAGSDITPVIIGTITLADVSDVYLVWEGIEAIGGVPQLIQTTGDTGDGPSTSLILIKYA